MPAPISIVIPTLDAADRIGPTLAALTEGLGAGLIRELIISDGGSGDDIAGVAEESGAVLITGSAGRGAQLARGAAAAHGAWLMFVHADSRPESGWSAAVAAHLERGPCEAGYFDLRFAARGMAPLLIGGWANLRSRMFGLPYGDQGLLVSAALYRNSGGYPSIPLMEDVALARRIGRRRLRPLGYPMITSAERYRREGWLRRGTLNLTTLALYFAGRDPLVLARRYRGGDRG